MASYNLFLLPGDGIGPEVMKEVEAIIAWFNAQGIASFETDRGLVGGCAYDAHGQAISEADMAKAMASDAVLFGAVGGPKWDKVPYDKRPEAGLLRLRKDLGLARQLMRERNPEEAGRRLAGMYSLSEITLGSRMSIRGERTTRS